MSKATENLKNLQHGKIILAEGEVTGHAHRLYCEGAVYDPTTCVLELPAAAPLTHEEHKTVGLPQGKHFVQIKKEYDPFEDAVRKVRD